MTGRVWFGPAGAELIGQADDGTPVTAYVDGVGRMHEVTHLFADAGITPLPWQAHACGFTLTEQPPPERGG